ncbi:MAG: hypothetical protein V3V08_09420 [Nannocystaceae bacterium]
MQAELLNFCRAEGLGVPPNAERARRAAARLEYLGSETRDALYHRVDPMGAHVKLMCEVAEVCAEDVENPHGDCEIFDELARHLGSENGFAG